MFVEDIKRLTKENENFRKVLHTGVHSQIVAMSIVDGEDIGEEVHDTNDQMLFIIDGDGEAVIAGETRPIGKHDVVFVPAGIIHNIKNTGKEALKLFTVYAPPEHPDGTVHKTKQEALNEEKEKI